MNSLACGAMLFGSATSIADERDKKRSIVIMIILMEVLLASILIGGDTNSYFKHYLNIHIYSLPKGSVQSYCLFFFFFFPFKSIKKWSICGVCYYLVHIFYGLNFLKTPTQQCNFLVLIKLLGILGYHKCVFFSLIRIVNPTINLINKFY